MDLFFLRGVSSSKCPYKLAVSRESASNNCSENPNIKRIHFREPKVKDAKATLETSEQNPMSSKGEDSPLNPWTPPYQENWG